MTLDYAHMVEVASEEAFAGLAEGGVPIGAAVFDVQMNLIGRGHNRRVQDSDPSSHGETDAFRKCGRQATWRDKILVTSHAPCWYCTGLVYQFGFRTLVVASMTTPGVPWLRTKGVEVVEFDTPELVELLTDWAAANPAVAAEDFGEGLTVIALDYERMLDVAIEEAFAGLAEGGVPIGGAVFDLQGNLIGRGHNMRVQENDPSIHGETSAFRNAGRHATWSDKIMVSTLSPCRYCSGLIYHFGFPILVVGESTNSKTGGGVPWLIDNGIEVVQFQSPKLIEMFSAWSAANPELWAEDGGDPIDRR